MLYYVSGTVAVLEPGLAVIDCGGVGYGCRVTAYTAGQLKLNQNARLYITESIREDAFDLYGFISREEQRCFELLTSVNGVGPKAALAILSSGGPQNFTLAVMTGDEKMLTAAQGVGKKLAQRIILELKEKIGGSSMELDFSAGTPSAAPAQTAARPPWREPPCRSWATPPWRSPPPSRALTRAQAPRKWCALPCAPW